MCAVVGEEIALCSLVEEMIRNRASPRVRQTRVTVKYNSAVVKFSISRENAQSLIRLCNDACY